MCKIYLKDNEQMVDSVSSLSFKGPNNCLISRVQKLGETDRPCRGSGFCGDCFGRLWGLQQTPRPNARKKTKTI